MTLVACVGSGQLAMMLGEAGSKLSIRVRSAGQAGSCAFLSCEPFNKQLDTEQDLDEFLCDVDVFTFESEHEGIDVARRVLDYKIPVYPSADFVETAGDRLKEKSMLDECKIPVANWQEIPNDLNEIPDISSFLNTALCNSNIGIVVKTRRGGYDGKGQWVIKKDQTDLVSSASAEIAPLVLTPGLIIEDLVDFSMECSILATRSLSGEFVSWPLTHNIHEKNILRRSEPLLSEQFFDLQRQAVDVAKTICDTNNYVGTIAIECFVADDKLVINEIAPRVHNSGHWTIEGSQTSQFEQHLRAISGLNLGKTDSIPCVMINLVGVQINESDFYDLEGTFVHWYSKQVREERKVGHITIVGSTTEQIKEREKKVMAILNRSTS